MTDLDFRGCGFPRGCDDATKNGGAGCYLCDVVSQLPQPRSARELLAERRQENVTRDGAPPTKRRDPTFTPRRRVGPHR